MLLAASVLLKLLHCFCIKKKKLRVFSKNKIRCIKYIVCFTSTGSCMFSHSNLLTLILLAVSVSPVPISHSLARCVAPDFRRRVIISVHEQTIYKFFRDLAALFLCVASSLAPWVLPSPSPEIEMPHTWFHNAFTSPSTTFLTPSRTLTTTCMRDPADNDTVQPLRGTDKWRMEADSLFCFRSAY